MKLLKFVISVLVFAGTSTSFAQTSTERPTIAECQSVYAACQAAGYQPGAHQKGQKRGEGQGLWVDCVNAVAAGKKEVAGVELAAAQSCMAAKKAHKAEASQMRQQRKQLAEQKRNAKKQDATSTSTGN